MSDGELLDPVTSSGDASIPVSAGNVVMSSGHLADSPHRSYYIWKEPPRQQQQQQGPPQGSYFYVQIPQARVWAHYISTLVLFLPDHRDLNSCANPEPQLKV